MGFNVGQILFAIQESLRLVLDQCLQRTYPSSLLFFLDQILLTIFNNSFRKTAFSWFCSPYNLLDYIPQFLDISLIYLKTSCVIFFFRRADSDQLVFQKCLIRRSVIDPKLKILSNFESNMKNS